MDKPTEQPIGGRMRDYLDDDLRRVAVAFFRHHGIDDPTPCQVAWYCFNKSGRHRSVAPSVRMEQQRNRGQEFHRWATDVLYSPDLGIMVRDLCRREQGLDESAIKELYYEVCGEAWAETPRHVTCEDVAAACVPWRCPTHEFGGPSWEEYCGENHRPIRDLLAGYSPSKCNDGTIRAVQVPMAGQKTTALAEHAYRLLTEDGYVKPFYILVDTLSTGDDFFAKLHKYCQGKSWSSTTRIVFLIGISETSCRKCLECHYRDCSNCDKSHYCGDYCKHASSAYKGYKRFVRPGVFDQERLKSLSLRGYAKPCPHVLSKLLARNADAVVMAQHYFLTPHLRKSIPKLAGVKSADRNVLLFWDEADTMVDCLTKLAIGEIPIVGQRAHKPWASEYCLKECSECSLSDSYLESVKKGLDVFARIVRILGRGKCGIDIDKVKENLLLVEQVVSTVILPQSGDNTPCEKLSSLAQIIPKDVVGLHRLDFQKSISDDDEVHAELRRGIHGFAALSDRSKTLGYEPSNQQECGDSLFLARVCFAIYNTLIKDFLRFAYITNSDSSRLEINLPRRVSQQKYTMCGMNLRSFDNSVFTEALAFIKQHVSVLQSGTFLQEDLLSLQLGTELSFTSLGAEQMHDSVVFLVWNHSLGAAVFQEKENPTHPLEMLQDDVLDLLVSLHGTHTHPKTLVFLDSKRNMSDFIDHAGPDTHKTDRTAWSKNLCVQRLTARSPSDVPAKKAQVDVSYLRSPESRGMEFKDHRFSILYGNGMQNSRDYRLLASARPVPEDCADEREVLDKLGKYGRNRAVAQAATRTCRDDVRRVVLLAGEYTPDVFPKYMQNRIVYVNEILESAAPFPGRAEVGGEPNDKRKWQLEVTAEWINDWLSGRSFTPDRRSWSDLCGMTQQVAEQQFHELLQTCVTRTKVFGYVYEKIVEFGFVQPSGKTGRRGVDGWREALTDLESIFVLQRDHTDKKGNRHKYVPGPYYAILSEWYAELPL